MVVVMLRSLIVAKRVIESRYGWTVLDSLMSSQHHGHPLCWSSLHCRKDNYYIRQNPLSSAISCRVRFCHLQSCTWKMRGKKLFIGGRSSQTHEQIPAVKFAGTSG